MFNKEAEEYREKGKREGYYLVSQEMEQEELDYIIDETFKDGAEFGYNKAKEDADKMKSQFLELCNLKDMRIAELEKANEWHYVKDGDLPKENKKYWILTSNREPKVDSWLTISWVYSYEVIAWKEILLPELKESE